MNSADYWKQRAKALEELAYQQSLASAKEIHEAYEKALNNIQKEIDSYYARYATDNKMSYADAMKELNARELHALQMDVKEYIRKGRTLNYSDKYAEELQQASTSYHLKRVQALEINLKQHICQMYSKQNDVMGDMAKEIYQSGFDHTTYELQRKAGYSWGRPKINETMLDQIVQRPWAPDGMTFSQRIWQNQEKLCNVLQQEMTQSAIRGEALKDVASRVAQEMGVSYNNAYRLVRTESAHFHTQSARDSFKENGIEKYTFIAAVDDSTCGECADLDNQTFSVDEMMEGVNAPPIHPNCRCSIAPASRYADLIQKAASEWPDSVEIPQNISFDQWSKNANETELGNQGIKRVTQVPSSVINSGEFAKKYRRLGESKKVREIMTSETKRILSHRSGTKFEDLIVINALMHKYITRTDYNEENRVEPSVRQTKMILDAEPQTIIAIHNHPLSVVPSPDDLFAAQERRYKYGIVVFHNGVLVKYSVQKEANVPEYYHLLAKLDRSDYSIDDIRKFTEAVSEIEGISMEVL